MLRRLPLLFLALLTLASPASAQQTGGVDVVEVAGVIDDAKVDYVLEVLDRAATEGVQVVIVRLDSPGAVTERTAELETAFTTSTVPVVVWVGDAPAQALGAAARLVEAAHLRTAAPGAIIGHGDHQLIGGDAVGPGMFDGPPVTVEPATPSLDRVEASLGQVVVWLDGRTVETPAGSVTLRTAEEITDEDGSIRLQQTVDVRFVEPNLWVRLLDLTLGPGTLFFFLAIGLTIVAFEFYAVGPGVAAAVALIPLVLAGYGLGRLPVTWHGVGLLLVAIGLFVVDYQRGGFRPRSWIATGMLLAGGALLVDGAPTLGVPWGSVVATTVAVALFFAVAMPVVARSRFSTGTFGRDHLIGRLGTAVGAFEDGVGIIDLDGARWKASAHRQAGIDAGDDIVVASVQGLWLEVERTPEDPRS